MEDKQYKKFYRKADKHLNGKIKTEEILAEDEYDEEN